MKTLFEKFVSLLKKNNNKPKSSERRKWRLTYYYIADEKDAGDVNKTIKVYDQNEMYICSVTPQMFSNMSLEGTGKLLNGKLLNVSGKFMKVNHEDYKDVLAYHKLKLQKRPVAYSGLKTENDKVTEVLTFRILDESRLGNGYGILRNIPLEPFKTLAADIGLKPNSDPIFKGSGGVCPPGTKVFIEEFVGFEYPDLNNEIKKHDGWFVVNDTGGGIFGAHFDLFVGSKSLIKGLKIPTNVTIWYENIEKLPENYDYGLRDV